MNCSPASRRAQFGRFLLAILLLLAAPGVSKAVDLSGCWSGTWQSCTTRHHGPLNAEFVRLNESQYEVFFQGRFFVIMPFKYSVVMTATEQHGVVHLSGSQYLGRMFGTFSFNARATGCQFNAHYSSCKDSGQFTLSRCTYAASCAK
jgi:hypothetical protein